MPGPNGDNYDRRHDDRAPMQNYSGLPHIDDLEVALKTGEVPDGDKFAVTDGEKITVVQRTDKADYAHTSDEHSGWKRYPLNTFNKDEDIFG